LSNNYARPFRKLVHYGYVILDRDSKFDADVITFLKATGLEPRAGQARADADRKDVI
jgi:hypothetical protein